MAQPIEKSPLIIVLGILTVITISVSVLFWREMNLLNEAYSDMNQIEFLSSSTQRLISIAQTETFLQKDVFFIGDSTQKALTEHTDSAISVLTDPAMVVLANDVLESWNRIEALLQEEPVNTIDLGLARDDHFKSMTNLSNGINSYAKEINEQITQYQIAVLILFFSIAMVMLNNLLRTHTLLKQSETLAKTAQIDTATGLFNRSRCQELFKNNKNTLTKKKPAILVIDLNDLKKTNDTLGHRVGDELIYNFAKVLINACEVHVVPPFIGRYGGDEFLVYYDDIESESDINSYLKEVSFLTEKFNTDETRFQLSYAVGYAYISNESEDHCTTRQLFDKADEAMYKNKVEMKRAKNPEYDEQVSRGEDVR